MLWHCLMTVQPMVSWGMRRGNIWFFTVCEIYPRSTEASRLVCKSCPRDESTLNNAMVTYSLLFILSVYPWRLNFNILTDFNGIWLDSLLCVNWLRCKKEPVIWKVAQWGSEDAHFTSSPQNNNTYSNNTLPTEKL